MKNISDVRSFVVNKKPFSTKGNTKEDKGRN